MIAHTQTLFGAVALVAVIMGSCLILVGQLRHRDGMLTTGLGMLSHALAYNNIRSPDSTPPGRWTR